LADRHFQRLTLVQETFLSLHKIPSCHSRHHRLVPWESGTCSTSKQSRVCSNYSRARHLSSNSNSSYSSNSNSARPSNFSNSTLTDRTRRTARSSRGIPAR
jgi:hypothetical protein